jgi:hypothetical protein
MWMKVVLVQFGLYQDYIHKVSFILHDYLQRESRKPYGSRNLSHVIAAAT